MAEPKAVAPRAEEVVPGVWHWSVHDERIDFVSSAHAVAADDGIVLIDPLPLEPSVLAALGAARAICLTCGSHQRSAWRYRRELGVPVHAPAGVRLVDEEPDVRYSEGDVLPGGLRTFFTPGPGTTAHSLLLEREPAVLFCADAPIRIPDGRLALVPDEYADDLEEERRTIRRLLEIPFSVLCLGHGAPVAEDAHAALRELLNRV